MYASEVAPASYDTEIGLISARGPCVSASPLAQSGYLRFKQYCEADPFCTESGFVTFLIAEQAMIDKEGAWKAALKLPDRVFELECAVRSCSRGLSLCPCLGVPKTQRVMLPCQLNKKKTPGTFACPIWSGCDFNPPGDLIMIFFPFKPLKETT